jgi:uncharacterized protein YdhG (YjbR/CyaY superfamily)
MKKLQPKSSAVDAYIRQYPANVRKILAKIRDTIRKAAPDAEEIISYMMPAYRINSVLVYFAGFKDHVSFFPTSSGVKAFKKELGKLARSKGTIWLPLDEPVPYGLIRRITRFRVRESSIVKKKKA